MSNKQKECYWDKSIDMSKATLQVDGKVVCKFDNDNQTVILVNEGFKTLREIELEARVKELEEQLKRKEQECEALKSESFTRDSLISMQEEEIDRYLAALEEIKNVINNILNSCLGHETKGCTPVHNVCGDLIKILDIIHKAKGEGKCQ